MSARTSCDHDEGAVDVVSGKLQCRDCGAFILPRGANERRRLGLRNDPSRALLIHAKNSVGEVCGHPVEQRSKDAPERCLACGTLATGGLS